jgi:hypothetical protein
LTTCFLQLQSHWGKQFETSLEKLEGDIKRNQDKVKQIKDAIDTINSLVSKQPEIKGDII